MDLSSTNEMRAVGNIVLRSKVFKLRLIRDERREGVGVVWERVVVRRVGGVLLEVLLNLIIVLLSLLVVSVMRRRGWQVVKEGVKGRGRILLALKVLKHGLNNIKFKIGTKHFFDVEVKFQFHVRFKSGLIINQFLDLIFGERFYLELDVLPVGSRMQTKIPGIKERNFAKKINPKNIVNKTRTNHPYRSGTQLL